MLLFQSVKICSIYVTKFRVAFHLFTARENYRGEIGV